MDNVFQEALHGLAGSVRSHAEAHLTSTFDRAEHDRLVVAPMSRGFLLAAESSELAANVGFVGLNDAVEHVAALVDHRGPDAVAEVPGGLIGDAERSFQLVRANALLRLDHEVHREEPFRERQLGVVEQRFDAYRELVAA